MQRLENLFKDQKFNDFITDYKAIEDKIEDMDKMTLKPMLALAYFHTEQYALSTELFAQMCEFTKDINIWFNLSTSAVLNGEYERGSQALEQAIQNCMELTDDQKRACIPIPYMLLYIINAFIDEEQYTFAFQRLHQLASIYIQVNITDTHYLYVRGIPSFAEFLAQVEKVLPLQTEAKANDWLNALSERVDEEGKKQLEELKNKLS